MHFAIKSAPLQCFFANFTTTFWDLAPIILYPLILNNNLIFSIMMD